MGSGCGESVGNARPAGAGGRSPRVLWGRKRNLGGDSHLVARSGLWFTRLTGAQHAALADSLQQLAALPSLVDSQQRSA